MRRWIFGLSAAVGTTALVLACSVGTDCDFGLCAGPTVGPGGAEAGSDSETGTDGAITPPGCKPELDPKDSPPCVVDSYGIFVDASKGIDANPGTKAAPVKTLAAAISKAGGLPRIYVCEGTYAEHAKLTRAISIYGGYACGGWSYSGGKTTIAPSDAGISLQISNATTPVVIADLEIIAQPGTKTEPSSVSVFVARSTDVTGRRLSVSAGAGFGGASGAPAQPAPTPTTTSPSINGNGGTSTLGGAQNVCTCSTGGTTTGGKGGDLGSMAPDGVAGAPAQASPSGGTGAGQSRTACESSGAAAQRGSDAPLAADASPTAAILLDENGSKVGLPQNGMSGVPGQGGGGGGSNTMGAATDVGGGGGGACGGCGGGGGGGGTAGGSSLAVVSFESSVKLETSKLVASDAGGGGDGMSGANGGGGGTKGMPYANACSGGSGGSGGKGGGGAGGSGGISAGVLHKGAAPVIDAATDANILFGKPGKMGAGGGQANDGQPGDAKKVVAL